MSYNGIDPNEISFQCILLMDRYMIRQICAQDGTDDGEYLKNLSTALAYNDAVAWYSRAKAPEIAGQVVGDDYDREIAELERVVKSGGWILDCPGEEDRRSGPNQELLKRGFEFFYYVGKTGGDIYRYRKQVNKMQF